VYWQQISQLRSCHFLRRSCSPLFSYRRPLESEFPKLLFSVKRSERDKGRRSSRGQ
jgi:hypothetical protein